MVRFLQVGCHSCGAFGEEIRYHYHSPKLYSEFNASSANSVLQHATWFTCDAFHYKQTTLWPKVSTIRVGKYTVRPMDPMVAVYVGVQQTKPQTSTSSIDLYCFQGRRGGLAEATTASLQPRFQKVCPQKKGMKKPSILLMVQKSRTNWDIWYI